MGARNTMLAASDESGGHAVRSGHQIPRVALPLEGVHADVWCKGEESGPLRPRGWIHVVTLIRSSLAEIPSSLTSASVASSALRALAICPCSATDAVSTAAVPRLYGAVLSGERGMRGGLGKGGWRWGKGRQAIVCADVGMRFRVRNDMGSTSAILSSPLFSPSMQTRSGI